MPDFNPTDEQLAIIDAARSTSSNLIVHARAGAAKTSSLVLLANALPSTQMTCLAFNVAIKKEMEARMPANCKALTLNGLGHRAWQSFSGKRLTLEADKCFALLKEEIKALPKRDADSIFKGMADILKIIRAAKSQGYIPAGLHRMAKPLLTSEEFFAGLDEIPTPLEEDLVNAVLTKSFRMAQADGGGKIDFDDQILLPAIMPVYFDSPPLTLVDESQDLSPINHTILKKLVKTNRIIAVGDPCQPDGTLITKVVKKGDRWNAPKLSQVSIEDIVVGDTVLGYDSCGSFMYNRRVEGITRREYDGDLVEVVQGHKLSRYTPNHICYANFKPLEDKTALYLMRRGEHFRIGKARFDEGCGPVMRARAEEADAVWLLCITDKLNAAILEAWTQAHFGLPDLTFISPEQGGQMFLDTFWSMMESTDLGSRAKDCLQHFGRDMSFPFWQEGQLQVSVRRPFLIRACNLLSGCLMLPYEGQKVVGRTEWRPVYVGRSAYSGFVTSFTISDNSLYVADGIVTHNCQAIYGFRGALGNSMDLLQAEFSMEELKLTTTFRCPQAVVREAWWRAPDMRWPSWAAEGMVDYWNDWKVEELPDNAAIICRNNAPIFSLAFKILRSGRKPELIGNDILKGMVKTLKALGGDDTPAQALHSAIDMWLEQQEKRSRAPKALADKADCLHIIVEQADDLRGALAWADHLEKSAGRIKLMTGHKSKGLEFPVVFFLDQHLCKPEEGQDDNVKYVVQTRAKETLTYITSEGCK